MLHIRLFVCSAAVTSATGVHLRFQIDQTSHSSIFTSSLYLNSTSFTSSGHFSCFIHSSCSRNISECITPFCCSTFSIWITYTSYFCLGLKASTFTPSQPPMSLSFLFTRSLHVLLLQTCTQTLSHTMSNQISGWPVAREVPHPLPHWATWTSASGFLLQCLGPTSPHAFCSCLHLIHLLTCLLSHSAWTHIPISTCTQN